MHRVADVSIKNLVN